jgi:hypothetical protein
MKRRIIEIDQEKCNGCVLGLLLYTVLRPGRGKRLDCDRAE